MFNSHKKSRKTALVVHTSSKEAPPMDDGRAEALFKLAIDALNMSISEKRTARASAAKVIRVASQVHQQTQFSLQMLIGHKG